MANRTIVVNWGREVERISKPYKKKFDALFATFRKETKGLNTELQNAIWNTKYASRYARIEKQMDSAYDKFYYKYHNKNNKVKGSYKIIIK